MEFSTVEESEQGSSATDSLSEDVTDGWKNEEGKKKNHSSNSQLPITNAQCFSAPLPITNAQFPKQIGRAPHALSISN
ncbi:MULTISPECIES: hypothetical protein [unclassified Microcoleus]|uniref:hypothetical protein n=1 Tax=unclassified Microcoleus TaxID=2642155 RepID=UPI002FD52E6C